MFLNALKKRNPDLLHTAIQLHQENKIPANTWVVDLDTIQENAQILYEAKLENGLETYVMAKQHARNPLITNLAVREGLNAAVCVDEQCCHVSEKYDTPVGHVGHLNQIPKRDLEKVMKLNPQVWTVFCVEQARIVSDVAAQLNVKQDILLRVYREGDTFFNGQEGGFAFEKLIDDAREIMKLKNVTIVGTVSFPCMKYDPTGLESAKITQNMNTIVKAAQLLQDELDVEIKQINAPGNTSSATFSKLKAEGATHVEPGHGLLGTTPAHAWNFELKERPAYCYVTEVTHKYNGMAYAHGGGLWQDIYNPEFENKVLVGSDPQKAFENETTWKRVNQIIDYHAPLADGDRCKVGDSAVFGIRTQMHMTRSWIAIVKGIKEKKAELAGLFDHAGNMLDPITLEVLPLAMANEQIHETLSRYGCKQK